MYNWIDRKVYFLNEYKNENYFVGAILTGSYATGNQNINSDIDSDKYVIDGATEQKTPIIGYNFVDVEEKEKEILMVYKCYPFNNIKYATQRYVIYAELEK